MAGVWKEVLQWPVKISQVLTTPALSLEVAIPSATCRLTDLIETGASSVDSESGVAGSADEEPVCQNLTDLSKDDEIREEENVREVISPVCPVRVSTKQGSGLVMLQM